jgi:hypothetical protein
LFGSTGIFESSVCCSDDDDDELDGDAENVNDYVQLM